MSDFIARVIAELDTNKAQSQLNSFLNGKHTLDIDVNLNTKNGNIGSFLNQIKSQFGSAGSTAGNTFANQFNSSIGNINTNNSVNTIRNLQRTLAGFKFDRSQINTITQSIDSMDVAVQKVETRIREGGLLDLRVTGVDELGRTVTILKQFDSATGTLTNLGKNITQTFGQMFTSNDVSKLNADLSSLDANFSKLKGSTNTYSAELAKLKSDLSNISNIGDLGRQQAEFERITQEVVRLKSAYKEAKAENDKLASSQQLLSSRNILGNQITTWMNKNTKAAKIYRTELDQIQKDLSNVGNMSELKSVTSAFNQLKSTASAAGNLGKSTFSTLIGNMTKLSPLFGMGTLITRSVSEVKNMISTVVDLDTALVDLRKTTTMSDSELATFYTKSNDIAKQMGVSTAEIINQASAWSRLGYSSSEAAQSMAKLSSQFASISPGMDVETATDGLVSIMKAYNVDVDNVLDGIMSKINIIGNTAATSNADIVDMLSRSSAAMAEANNTLDETIALETAAFEITQNASTVGNAFKTISMRIRGYDEETGEYIGNIEDLTGKIADLTKTASTPGGISLFKDDAKTEFKSTTELLREISQIYDDLTDKDQAQLLEVLAGKRNGQVVAATLGNFEAVEKALENMKNSAGSADAEMAVITDSLEFKLNALKETGTGIAQNLFQRGDMKAVVDGFTGVLNIIDKVTEKLGLFGTITVGAGLIAFFKNLD